MAKKKKPQECPAGEKWAVPYADFLSLLLALFIALWAISDSSKSKTEALQTEFIKIFDHPKTVALKGQKSGGTENANKDSLSGKNSSANAESEVGEELMSLLDQKESQVALDFPASIKFLPRSSDINDPDIINFIKIVSLSIKKLPPQVNVEVRGYADDYSDDLENFKLASQRAYNVTKLLSQNGIDPKILTFSAHTSTKNVLKNANSKSVKIYFKVNKNDVKTQKSVLDSIENVQK
ncbi:flagellar motor protein MotB [Campylobacter sputorum subsp. bubulus]|uniref:Flagellar motor protein MotB n=1 Tax=Campylobacter sputorum subsp. sputorum TaxID=32024 RepID=A0A381DKV6_9BACT|nr:flagellar motor protein MotB [Campylobacter sputorum]ASM34548.1 flagellar motor protein [Campylobacter sputorum aubsp. sputorum RM3237]KAB0580771.1 flagellar motor protein MotB [Campylobacter sputorum subsp. sputorum]QEL04738.1 flagellar motor stator protein [Campylobacter sputorum subsp. sputorum]SUX09650.1 flagellar motor protein MotB [Campylobacter sputorum subsp. bubulus]SUX11220.1 flagellar motor protein MotB [Campylobacter sputorum subsp. sputorum]